LPDQRLRSEWREFAFALHQIQDTIEPALPLETVLTQWNRLAAALAENRRKRTAQSRTLNETTEVTNMSNDSRSPFPLNTVAVASSVLAQVAYDERRAILHMVFRDGAIYQYSGVPLPLYRELLRAESKGTYFNHHIRSVFPCASRRAATPAAGQVPAASAQGILG
jgi:hypothetical protein